MASYSAVENYTNDIDVFNERLKGYGCPSFFEAYNVRTCFFTQSCRELSMRYVYTEQIINACALRLSHDWMQVLKIVPYIRRHSF